jgi:hypothetical protein
VNIRYVKYVCSSCGAEDTDKLFSHELQAPVINCWKCHAGFQKEVGQMLRSNTGMFPVQESNNAA